MTAPVYAHVISLSTATPDVCVGPDPDPAVDPVPVTAVATYELPPLVLESPTCMPAWLIAHDWLPPDAFFCIF